MEGRKIENRCLESQGEDGTTSPADFLMSIHLISDNILRYLHLQDLLNCGRVNRHWNAVGRTFIREKRKCLVVISSSHSCKALRRFAYFLATSFCGNFPFNGLSIRVEKDISDDCVQDVSMVTLRSFFQTQFDLKFLKIHWGLETTCAIEDFLREILQNKHSDLHGLTLSKLPVTISSLRDYFKQVDYFIPHLPRLKKVKICDVSNHNVINEILSAAPAVRRIVGTVTIEQLLSFMAQGKSPFITDFEFYPTPGTIDLCWQLAQSKPKLESLAVLTDGFFPQGKMEPFVKTLFALTGSCSSSLKILNIDHVTLIMLSEYQVEPFPVLNNLQLGYGGLLDKIEGYLTLCRIDYDRLFPGLQKVDLDNETIDITNLQIFQSCPIWIKRPSSFHTCKVNTLTINHADSWDDDVFRSLAFVFPEVVNIHVELDDIWELISLVWVNWPFLQSVTFDTKDFELLRGLDFLFLGISTEEADNLSRESIEYLKSFELVPTLPSITSLKHLRRLQLSTQKDYSANQSQEIDQFFPLPLTRHLAFARMPGLYIQLIRSSCLRTSHI